jgi:nicotinate-nucleotide--dimethylbenzimidazole phosphoribosyltransferase
MHFYNIAPVGDNLKSELEKHLNSLTKPVGSLGMLEEIAIRLGLIQQTIKPNINKKRVYVFASDHGITQENVSAYPKEVTREMVNNILMGGAAINVFGRLASAEVLVVDAGVDHDFNKDNLPDTSKLVTKKPGFGTRNFAKEPAMAEKQAIESIEFGCELAEMAAKDNVDVLVIGDMGIGNTTVAAAVCVAAGFQPDEIIDIGTVIDEETLKRKRRVILDGIKLHKPNSKNAIDILQKVGGFCIAEMTGVILKAASLRIPVVLDGFPVTSAAILANMINPNIKGFLFAGHLSKVKGHGVLLKALNLTPILKLDMRLGEGTGGVLALHVMEAATNMIREMATFESAGVSKGNEVV